MPLVPCALAASFTLRAPLRFPRPSLLFLLGKWRRDGAAGASLGRRLASLLGTIDLKQAIAWIASTQTPVRFLLTILIVTNILLYGKQGQSRILV